MHSSNSTTAQHDAVVDAMGGLVVCPIDLEGPDLRILDSGTGDANWLQDLVRTYPRLREATLVGTDLVDVGFPKDGLPSSISLQIQSITEPWPVEWRGSFDLVQQRLVLGACGTFPHGQTIRNLAELVKPGGWIQLIEPDQTCGIKDGQAMNDFITLVTWVFDMMGGGARYAYGVKQWVQEAGFVNVEEFSIPLFLGAQIPDKELAERTARSTADAMLPLLKYLEVKGGTSPLPADRLESLVPRLYKELQEQGGFYPIRVIRGQVPMAVK